MCLLPRGLRRRHLRLRDAAGRIQLRPVLLFVPNSLGRIDIPVQLVQQRLGFGRSLLSGCKPRGCAVVTSLYGVVGILPLLAFCYPLRRQGISGAQSASGGDQPRIARPHSVDPGNLLCDGLRRHHFGVNDSARSITHCHPLGIDAVHQPGKAACQVLECHRHRRHKGIGVDCGQCGAQTRKVDDRAPGLRPQIRDLIAQQCGRFLTRGQLPRNTSEIAVELDEAGIQDQE
ncbi:hypothetical protein D3C85_1023520 [compost metagenome]